MTKHEFILQYARFHLHIDKQEHWDKIEKDTQFASWAKQVYDLFEWEASRLFEYLVRIGEIKDTSTCPLCGNPSPLGEVHDDCANREAYLADRK